MYFIYDTCCGGPEVKGKINDNNVKIQYNGMFELVQASAVPGR